MPSTAGGANRSGLLGEIGTFKKGGLKKATTNDRSAPLVAGSSTTNSTANNGPTSSARNSISNRSNGNERPSTAPVPGLFNITPNQLNTKLLKPAGGGGSTIKVQKATIPQFAPPPPPPPPTHQPVVKTPPADISRNGGETIFEKND
jgi:hypothetical protein